MYNTYYKLKFSFTKVFGKTYETACDVCLFFMFFLGGGGVNIYLYSEAMGRNCTDGGYHAVQAAYCLPKFLFPSGPIHPAKSSCC